MLTPQLEIPRLLRPFPPPWFHVETKCFKRRDKATSNICTAQALLANMAASYGVYHGPEGVKDIAARINGMAAVTHGVLKGAGFGVPSEPFFDTFPGNSHVIIHSSNSTMKTVWALGRGKEGRGRPPLLSPLFGLLETRRLRHVNINTMTHWCAFRGYF